MKIDDLTKEVLKFRDQRGWKRYHNPRSILLSLVSEVGELADHFRWKEGKDLENYIRKNKEEIEDELSDVIHNALLLAIELKIDIPKSFLRKMEKNKKKYPPKK